MRDIEVPVTRTFPGIENPAFPYPQPEEDRRIAAVGRAGEVDVRP